MHGTSGTTIGMVTMTTLAMDGTHVMPSRWTSFSFFAFGLNAFAFSQ